MKDHEQADVSKLIESLNHNNRVNAGQWRPNRSLCHSSHSISTTWIVSKFFPMTNLAVLCLSHIQEGCRLSLNGTRWNCSKYCKSWHCFCFSIVSADRFQRIINRYFLYCFAEEKLSFSHIYLTLPALVWFNQITSEKWLLACVSVNQSYCKRVQYLRELGALQLIYSFEPWQLSFYWITNALPAVVRQINKSGLAQIPE